MEQGRVTVRKRGAARIRGGHVWIYRSDIIETEDVSPGAIVAVEDDKGTLVGKAFYSSESKIALRFLARGPVSIDESFFRMRLAAAHSMRERLGFNPRLSRRVCSEGDFLPGLIVDRYGDHLVVQCLTQGVDRLQATLIAMLQEQYQPLTILFKNDNKVRELEALPLIQDWAGTQTPPETVVVEQYGQEIEVPLRAGQKTGSYLDQQENYRAARRYGRGRAIDGFSYTGGFALQLAGVCDSVEAVDMSDAALQLARSNADRNGLRNIQCVEANVFDYLRDQHKSGSQYDTIVLDPPPFAKNRESLEGALRGYKEINNRAMRLLSDGGILITCSCSHHVSESLFAEMLAEAARDAHCWLRVLERRIQSADHPVLLAVPETLYLKVFILEIRY